MDVFFAEMIGTMMLVLLGNGVVAGCLLNRSKSHGSGWMVITCGWAFAVMTAVYLVGWVSGGHINPAVTLGLCIAQKCSWHQMPVYIAAQILGAMLGALLVYIVYRPHWDITEAKDLKLMCFSTKPAVYSPFWNFVCEMIATAVLLAGVLGILDPNNHVPSAIGPIAVGLLVLSIGLSLGGPTGYAINPARDLGPRIIHALLPMKNKGSSQWSYSWIPVLAPLAGAVVGALLYTYFFSSATPFSGFIR